MELKKTLTQIAQIPRASGDEKAIASLIESQLKPFAEITLDPMGNVIARLKSGKVSAKKFVISVNMDVSGFIVTNVEENGQVRLANLGAVHYPSAVYSSVTLPKGDRGLIIPTGDVDKDLNASKLYLDVGAKSKAEAEKTVSVGDTVTMEMKPYPIGKNTLSGYGVGSAAACAALLASAEQIDTSAYDISLLFTTQKQLGSRGAKAAFSDLVADIVLTIDLSSATAPFNGTTPLSIGGGPAIRIKDGGTVYSPEMIEKILSIASETGIALQREVTDKASNDASVAKVPGQGTLVGCLALPVAHIGTTAETVNLTDAENLVALIKAVVLKGEFN